MIDNRDFEVTVSSNMGHQVYRDHVTAFVCAMFRNIVTMSTGLENGIITNTGVMSSGLGHIIISNIVFTGLRHIVISHVQAINHGVLSNNRSWSLNMAISCLSLPYPGFVNS